MGLRASIHSWIFWKPLMQTMDVSSWKPTNAGMKVGVTLELAIEPSDAQTLKVVN